MRRLLLLALALTLVAPIDAQKAPKPVPRPKLQAGADTNDANAYWEYAWRRDVSWRKAYDAFYWAYRLQPDEIQLLHAFHQAFWMRQAPEWRRLYAEGADFVLKSKEAKFVDSLAYEVAVRNPMVYIRGPCYRIPELEEERDNVILVALIMFDNGCYKDAAARYATAIEKYPQRLSLRYDRAHALYRSGQYADAIGEIQVVLDSLRARDATKLVHQYQSRAILEFMIANSYLQLRNRTAAREAYGRALSEDLSLYWVHARLAELALAEGDTRTALLEYEQAVGLKENDGVLLHDYGVALMSAQRFADAEPHLRTAVELEPHFSTAYYNLAVSLDRQEKRAEALATYQEFMRRVPKRQVKMIITAQSRMKALEGPMTAGTGASPP